MEEQAEVGEMSFLVTSTAAAFASLLLGLGWMVGGKLMLKRWGLEPTAQGMLVGRRLGATYIGNAILLFFVRSAQPSEIRSLICIAMMVGLLLLAALGLAEFKAKRAGKAILLSVAVEVLLSVGFAIALLS
jgi:hypothetical protein